MKLLVFLALLFTIFNCAGQNIFSLPVDSATGKISFQGISSIEGLKKDELFNKVKLWVINSYPSPKDVINVEDKEIGVLKLKPIFKKQKKSDNIAYDEVIHFDLDLYVKDGKYKYILTNIRSSLLFAGDTRYDKNPIEKALLISKDDPEQMKHYEYRKIWSDEIKNEVSNLINSLQVFLLKKNDADF
jgi:hypothetical protein